MKFEEMGLRSAVLDKIKSLGFAEPTVIQAKAIPEILKGRDVVGHSLTGSGKTAAFIIPMCEKMVPGKGLQALVLTPTRELAVQVNDVASEIGHSMHLRSTAVYGGVDINPQVHDIRKSEIVIATPGRLLDHARSRTIQFDQIKFFVLDEVDRMFDMGFIDDVETIIRLLPKTKQTLLFSATMSGNITRMVKKHLVNPVSIKAQTQVDRSLLKQTYYVVDDNEKFSLLSHFLKNNAPGLKMVFCCTRSEVDLVASNLKANSINALAIHGGLTQNRRLHALDSLKREDITVLVATDVAARGLDIQNVMQIYNYGSPKTSEEYIHRIGRTARAGNSGEAITIISPRDYDSFRRVLEDRSLHVERTEKPAFARVPFDTSLGRRQGFSRGGRFSGGRAPMHRGAHNPHRSGQHTHSASGRFGESHPRPRGSSHRRFSKPGSHSQSHSRQS